MVYNWTTKIPTTSGFYWFMENKHDTPAVFYFDEDDFIAARNEFPECLFSDKSIPEPRTPK